MCGCERGPEGEEEEVRSVTFERKGKSGKGEKIMWE